MLFVIDKSIANALENGSKSQDDVVVAVESIATAHRRGYHLICAERKTLNTLKECPLLSEVTRHIYARAHQRFPQTGEYRKKFVRRVEIIASEGTFELSEEGECKVIRLSANYISNSSIASETIFLSENQSDISFYKKLAQAYMSWSGLGKIYIRCEPRGGGGQTTATEYESIQNRKNRLCLCIADSDRGTPCANIGGTAREVERRDDVNQPLCELVILNVREIENIIPTSMYKEAATGDVNWMKGVSFLERLESSKEPDARKYLDIKKGLKLGDILHVSPDSPVSKYWLRVLKILKISDKCWANEACTDKKSCTCIVAHSLGSKILDAVIKVIQQKSGDEVAGMVCELLKPEWEIIGEIITAWCCGSSRLSVIPT